MDEIYSTPQIQSETEENGVKITAAETKTDTLKPDMVLFTSWLRVSCEISSATVGKYNDILKSLDQKTQEKLGTSIFELRTLELLHNIFMGHASGIELNKDEKRALVYYVAFLLCEYVSFWEQSQWLNDIINPVSGEFENWLCKQMNLSYPAAKDYSRSLNAINDTVENENLSLFDIKSIKAFIGQSQYFLRFRDKKQKKILNYYLFYLLDLALRPEERQEEEKVGPEKSGNQDFEAWCLKREHLSKKTIALTKEFADRLSQYCVEHFISPAFAKISLEEQFRAVIDVYTSSEAYVTILSEYRGYLERYSRYLMDCCDTDRLMDILDVGRNDAHLPLLVSGEKKSLVKGYSRWLKSNDICDGHSIRTYISSLYACEEIAREQFSSSFFENKNKGRVAYLRFQVARHPHFSSKYVGALRMYVQYLSSYRLISKEEHEKNTRNLLELLNRRLGGEISLETDTDYDKLYSVWQKEYGTDLLYSREDIITMISQNTIFDSERHVYITKDVFLPEATQRKIFQYLRTCFESGARLVDYAQIVELIREDGLHVQVKELQEFLKKFNDGSYVCENKYILQANDSSLQGGNLASEICNKVREQTTPISKDALKALFPSISEDRFNKILARNNFSALYGVINPKQGKIFHADLICFTESELSEIKDLLAEELRSQGYVTSQQLFDLVRNVKPNILEEYAFLSPSSLYAVLRHKLGRDFKFNISCVTSEKTMEITDIFVNFCKQRDEFSLSDLLQLATQLGVDSVPFTYMYEISARVSCNLFVKRENLQFDTTYIDHLLDVFCPETFTIIGQFSHLDMLPPINGHPWSIYLLEHYLSFHSCKFSLFSRNYAKSGSYGFIVRKATGIQDFNEAVAQYLAHVPVELEAQAVLQHLCHVGILGVRRYTNIDELLNKARELRNMASLT